MHPLRNVVRNSKDRFVNTDLAHFIVLYIPRKEPHGNNFVVIGVEDFDWKLFTEHPVRTRSFVMS